MTVPLYNLTDTWNSGAATFTAIKMNVTDTASASASLLIDLQVGSVSKFNIDKNGSSIIVGHVEIQDTTSSVSTGTGALKVFGGVGIGENLNVAGTNNTVNAALAVIDTGLNNKFNFTLDAGAAYLQSTKLDNSASLNFAITGLFTANMTLFTMRADSSKFNGHVGPESNDGGQLGFNGTAWSDLYLASGAVINWNSGNITLTHAAGSLTFGPTSTNLVVGTAAIATNATDGFLYIPTCAGTPTGTPTTFTGCVPMIFDTTNSQFWFFTGGAWKQPKTPAGAAIVTWQ